MAGKRIIWIDELRGIAIILVILGHVIGGLEPLGGGTQNDLWKIIYVFHMPFLFIISGHVSTNCGEGYRSEKSWFDDLYKVLKKVTLSLYVPYLLWGYLFWGVHYFFSIGNKSATLKDGLCLPVIAYGPVWFLLCLFLIKIASFILESKIKNEKVITLIWIVFFILSFFVKLQTLDAFLKYGIYFRTGERLKENKKINLNYSIVALIVALVFYNTYVAAEFAEFVISIGVVNILIYAFTYQNSNSLGLLSILGKNSMIPYLLHPYVTIPVRMCLQKLGNERLIVYVLTELGIAVIVSWLAIKYAEKNLFFRRLFYPLR